MTDGTQGVESLTPEQIQALIKERDEAKQLADKHRKDLDGVVNQLTDEKERRRLAEEAAQKLQNPPSDLDAKIAEALSKKDRELAEQQRAEAFDEFIAKHKEFSPDVDTTGLRLKALKDKLGRFNVSSIASKKDMMSALEDAYALTVRGGNPSGASFEFASQPPVGVTPPAGDDNAVSQREHEIIRRLGWDVKKYLSIKTRYPDYVAKLLEN